MRALFVTLFFLCENLYFCNMHYVNGKLPVHKLVWGSVLLNAKLLNSFAKQLTSIFLIDVYF